MRDAFNHFEFEGTYTNHRFLYDDTGIIMCYSSDIKQDDDVIDIINGKITFWNKKKSVQRAAERSIENNKPLKFFREYKTIHKVRYIGEWVVNKIDFNCIILKKYISNEEQ